MTETVQTTAPTVTELSLQDLGTLVQIIDLASQRGAFKPAEMTAVGTTYSKLVGFLNNATAAQTPAPEADVDDAPDEPEVTETEATQEGI